MQPDHVMNIFDDIEAKMMDEETLGFSPDVLAALDNVEASESDIEMLKYRISHDILFGLFHIAGSVYYGSIQKGSIHTFSEVITRLGMHHAKAMIIMLAMHILSKKDEAIETVFARSFASSVIGRILAHQVGMREEAVKNVELGCLFSEIGRMILLIYKKLHAPDDPRIDENFIDQYHVYLTERIIDTFSLPDYLKTMLFHEGVVVEGPYITASGLVRLAVQFVSACFSRHRNHLIIEPVAAPSGQDESISLAHIIEDQFRAVGLEKYLMIVKKIDRLLPARQSEKS